MEQIIRAPHGTARAIVDVERIEIHDLWHIAMSLPEPQQSQVLDVWHLAHDMKEALKGNPDHLVD